MVELIGAVHLAGLMVWKGSTLTMTATKRWNPASKLFLGSWHTEKKALIFQGLISVQ